MSQAITRHPVCVAQAAPSRNARPSPNHVATAAPLHPLNRRQALLSTSGLAAVAVLVGLPPRGAAAADQLQQTYTDEADKFSLAVPAGWTMGTGDFGKSSMAGTGRQSESGLAGVRLTGCCAALSVAACRAVGAPLLLQP